MIKKILQTHFILLFIFVIFPNNGDAQQQTEISDSIYSKILKEQRDIKIKLPSEYKPGLSDKYEVIYITDGESNIDLFSFIFNFARGDNFAPPVILVAVCNSYINGEVMRDRDFLPEKIPGSKLAGGADNFIDFLKEELIPYIDKKYPSNGVNSIYGHSYGGLFTLYALLKTPELFNTYYCADPNFVWNENFIQKLALKTFENTPELDKTLWIAVTDSNFINSGRRAMETILKEKAPERLYWKTASYGNETHRSVRLKGIYDGVKFAYEGFNVSSLVFHPMGGVLVKDKPVTIMMDEYPNLYFTTDGTEPSETSEKAHTEIVITNPAIIRMKYISPKKKINVALKGVFDSGDTFAPATNPGAIEKGGLNYEYYEGKWEKTPEFDKLKPVKTGIIDNTFNVSNIKNRDNFACLITGYIKIEKEGYYIFGIDSDDGSRLYIKNRLLINHDGLHHMGSMKSYVVPLQKGFYPIRFEYFQNEEPAGLGMIYRAPDTSEAGPIPSELFYYRKDFIR